MIKNLKMLFLLKKIDKHGIAHEFSTSKTPQHNGVVERKNSTLQEMACVMLNSKKLSSKLWQKLLTLPLYHK